MEKSSTAYAVALSIVALLVIYILSIGPVMRLTDRGYINPETFEAIYAPLEPVARIPVLRHALMEYIYWWEPPHKSAL